MNETTIAPEPVRARDSAKATIRTAGRGLVSEAAGTAAMAAVVMVVSYSGLRSFAVDQHLAFPELFPLAFDLPALVAARAAWRAHRLGSAAVPARLFSAALVVMSALLQASPTLAKTVIAEDLWTKGLWAPLAAELGPP